MQASTVYTTQVCLCRKVVLKLLERDNKLAEWLERLNVNAKVAIVLGSIPDSPTQWNRRGADEAVLRKIPLNK
jgi:hypothetical protein